MTLFFFCVCVCLCFPQKKITAGNGCAHSRHLSERHDAGITVHAARLDDVCDLGVRSEAGVHRAPSVAAATAAGTTHQGFFFFFSLSVLKDQNIRLTMKVPACQLRRVRLHKACARMPPLCLADVRRKPSQVPPCRTRSPIWYVIAILHH